MQGSAARLRATLVHIGNLDKGITEKCKDTVDTKYILSFSHLRSSADGLFFSFPLGGAISGYHLQTPTPALPCFEVGSHYVGLADLEFDL